MTSRRSLVVITVTGKDPYELFESLNSSGPPLAESDVTRNFVFMWVPLSDQDEFFRDRWQPFESRFGATQGDDAPGATAFHRGYLTREGAYSRKGDAFVDFKEQLQSRDLPADQLVGDLARRTRVERGRWRTSRSPPAWSSASANAGRRSGGSRRTRTACQLRCTDPDRMQLATTHQEKRTPADDQPAGVR